MEKHLKKISNKKFILNFYTKYKKNRKIKKNLKSGLNIFLKNYILHGKNIKNMNS